MCVFLIGGGGGGGVYRVYEAFVYTSPVHVLFVPSWTDSPYQHCLRNCIIYSCCLQVAQEAVVYDEVTGIAIPWKEKRLQIFGAVKWLVNLLRGEDVPETSPSLHRFAASVHQHSACTCVTPGGTIDRYSVSMSCPPTD